MMLMNAGLESYGINSLRARLAELGQPKFRAEQVLSWVYAKGATSYDQMTNVPKGVRAALEQEAPLHVPRIVDKQVSRDETRKYVLELADGELVEAVGIPSRDRSDNGSPQRLTVCFSTQVGCPMGCTFCATGTQGFTRNLGPGEMALQIVAVSRDFDARVSNVVAMGQGEPFLNYDNLIEGLRIINDPKLVGIGARHITVSTCGIVEGIRRLAREPEQFTLAVSLHSAVQETRDALMPVSASTPLVQLRAELVDYYEASGRRFSLEYLMIDGVNSDQEHLDALVRFCNGLHAHVNLLAVNKVQGSPLEPCSPAHMKSWEAALQASGTPASIRDSRGKDIDAACGQLKNNVRPAG